MPCSNRPRQGKTITSDSREVAGFELTTSGRFYGDRRGLAEQGGAYWLLDIIAIAQQHVTRVALEEFQTWKLQVRADRSATVFCEDGNGNIVYTQEIPFTDFPLDEVKLYFANNVIHLPSEY
jgi:hypothetical protein